MSLTGAMTIDVEDYFQVQAFADVIDRESWERWPRRVEANTEWMLEALAARGVHATFFTLGWVAERHRGLVRRIVAAGHELASHGYGHQLVDRIGPEAFRADLVRARAALEDAGGVAVIGYRAPTFSIGPHVPWAWEILEETGHRYTSSLFPVKHDLYGTPDAARVPFRPAGSSLWEIPLTTVHGFGRNWPCAGGGYFRLLPYAAYRGAVRHLHRREGRPQIFYTHPWELDPGQPHIPHARLSARFRHRVNLGRMKTRFAALLEDFAWDRMDRVYADLLDPARPC
ncbi:XrtA system polysaccharide deacetylase [Acidiphilium sp.]|uniref:XrtA system polysaccharide deacetylase n=1 Tax=Acidiphilium sp. TaxID=527 RepID=UPI003CFD1CC0